MMNREGRVGKRETKPVVFHKHGADWRVGDVVPDTLAERGGGGEKDKAVKGGSTRKKQDDKSKRKKRKGELGG